MNSATPRFVAKVHPASRAMEPGDPMTLHATPVPGDPDVMVRAVVQEYAWMGWDAESILSLFRDPYYPALQGLWRALGESGVRERVAAVFGAHGVYRFRATIVEAPEGPDVVRIEGPSPATRSDAFIGLDSLVGGPQ